MSRLLDGTQLQPKREPHRDIGTKTDTVASDAHGPVVRLHQPLDERQGNAKPGVFTTGAALLLVEDLEDERQELRRDPLTGVAHVDHPFGPLPRLRHRNPAPARRELSAFSSTFLNTC